MRTPETPTMTGTSGGSCSCSSRALEQGERLFFLYVSTVLKDEKRVLVDPKDPEFHDTGLSERCYIYPGTVQELDRDDVLGEQRVGFLGPGYRQRVMDVLIELRARQRRKSGDPDRD